MRVSVAGVGCVGKTTIGAELASLLRVPFFDADKEIEAYLRVHIGGLGVDEAAEKVKTSVEDYLKEADEA